MWAHALHHSAWFGMSLLSNDFFSCSGFQGWLFLSDFSLSLSPSLLKLHLVYYNDYKL